jgi:hypothetical protein
VIPHLLWINKDESDLEGTNPSSHDLVLNFEYHTLGACFNPYIALSNLQIYEGLCLSSYPGGCLIYTSAFRTP